MSSEDWDDIEEDDELDEEDAVKCPECGADIYIVTDKCLECGFWLSEADRHAMWSGMSQSKGLKFAITVTLFIFSIFLLVGIISSLTFL